MSVDHTGPEDPFADLQEAAFEAGYKTALNAVLAAIADEQGRALSYLAEQQDAGQVVEEPLPPFSLLGDNGVRYRLHTANRREPFICYGPRRLASHHYIAQARLRRRPPRREE